MPGYQGVLLSAVIARREAPTTPAAPVDPKVVAQQQEAIKRLLDSLTPPAAVAK